MWGSILILIASCHWQTFQTFCRRMQRCFTFPCQYGSRVLVVTSVTNCQCPHKCWIGYLFPVCKISGKMPSCSPVYFLRFPMNICLTQHCYNVVSLIHMYTFVSARLSSGKWLSLTDWIHWVRFSVQIGVTYFAHLLKMPCVSGVFIHCSCATCYGKEDERYWDFLHLHFPPHETLSNDWERPLRQLLFSLAGWLCVWVETSLGFNFRDINNCFKASPPEFDSSFSLICFASVSEFMGGEGSVSEKE